MTRSYLDELMGVESCYRSTIQDKIDELSREPWETNKYPEAKVVDPPIMDDGSAGGLRIVFIDRDGYYRSPVMETKWIGDKMGNAWAVNPYHPNSREILDTYAKYVSEQLGYEPLQVTVSMTGKIDVLDNGAVVAQEMEIVDVVQYYKER